MDTSIAMLADTLLASGWPSPLTRAAHGWDVTPLLAAIGVVVVWRFGLRREITWPSVGVAVMIGLALGTVAAGWGLLAAWSAAIAVACVVVLCAPRRGLR